MDLASVTKGADILIVAVGKARMLKADMVKEGAVVIDVGVNRDEAGKLCGDVDFDEVNKVNVDGIDVNLLGPNFFSEVFGKNYENRKIKIKAPRASAILDTETSYEKIIKERKEAIKKIKVIQREIRKKRFEVMEETSVVNNVFNLVKMTDAQIKVQKFFERHRDYLFSLDMDDEEEFIELYDRLTPTINYLRRYSEYNMTFSIDEEADLLVKKVMLKTGEDELVDKLEELSKMEYFIE